MCAISLGSLACAAQAPIERREPGPVALGNRQWPTGKTLHRNTLLLVYTFDPYQPPSECRVREIAVDRLICHGRSGRGSVEYDRSAIAMLRKNARSVHELLFLGGLTSLGLSLLCAVDGGPLCLTPAVVGLSLLTAGLVALVVESVHRTHSLPLYEAPLPQVWLTPQATSGPDEQLP